MKHHRKTVGKHWQKKNGTRKTMKGGDWTNPFTWFSSTTSDSTTSDSTTSDTTTDTTTTSKPFSLYNYLPSLPSFLSSSKTAETSPQVVNNNNNTGTGGYMGGKRKGKTAKKPCAKKGGGK